MERFKKLKERIEKSGYKLSYLAEQLGITRFSLTNKLNGVTDFKSEEIKKLCLTLKIQNEDIHLYFFTEQ